MAHRVLTVSLAIVSVAGAVVIVLIYAGLIQRNRFGSIPYGHNKSVNEDAMPKRTRLQRKYSVNGNSETWRKQRLLLNPFL